MMRYETIGVMTFKVTETLQNGKEKRTTKKVYTKAVITMDKINEAIEVLESNHFYNIEFENAEYKNTYIV